MREAAIIVGAVGFAAILFSPLFSPKGVKEVDRVQAWVDRALERSPRRRVVVRSNPVAGIGFIVVAAAAVLFAVADGSAPIIALGGGAAVAALVGCAWVGGPVPIARLTLDPEGVQVGKQRFTWSEVTGVRVAKFRVGTSRSESGRRPRYRTRAELVTSSGAVSLPYGLRIMAASEPLGAVIAATHARVAHTDLAVDLEPRLRDTIGGRSRPGQKDGEFNSFAVFAVLAIILEIAIALIWNWATGFEVAGPAFFIITGLFAAAGLVCGAIGMLQIQKFAEEGRMGALIGIVVGGLTVCLYIGLLIEIL